MEQNINQENNNQPVQPTQPIMPNPSTSSGRVKKHQIPTWLGFLIIIVFTVLVFGGVFVWRYFSINNYLKVETSTTTKNGVTLVGDERDLPYKGYINKNMPIYIEDLDEKLEITGSVKQTINVGYYENKYADEDYNFDGFNDLKILVSAGAGYSAIYEYNIYLYNPRSYLFESFDKLKGVTNISVNKEKKKIVQTYKYFSEDGELVIKENEYSWQDVLDGKLENSRG